MPPTPVYRVDASLERGSRVCTGPPDARDAVPARLASRSRPESGRPDDGPGRATTDDLLLAAGRGDLDAFVAFYDSTASVVMGLLDGVLGRREAERLTEEVYLALWRGAPGFDPLVRSADATLLRTARRALVGPVRRLLTSSGARVPVRTEPAHRAPPDDHRRRRENAR